MRREKSCFIFLLVCALLLVHPAGHGGHRDVLQPHAGEGGARGQVLRKEARNRQGRLKTIVQKIDSFNCSSSFQTKSFQCKTDFKPSDKTSKNSNLFQ